MATTKTTKKSATKSKAEESTKRTESTNTTEAPSASREEVFKAKADQVAAKVKELISEGNARRIVVADKDGKVLMTIPVTFGVVGAVLAPWVAALGVLAAVVGECTIKVER